MGSFVLICKVCICMYSLYVHPVGWDALAMHGECMYVCLLVCIHCTVTREEISRSTHLKSK